MLKAPHAPCRNAPSLRIRRSSSARAQAVPREATGSLKQLKPPQGQKASHVTSQAVASSFPPPAFTLLPPPPALVAAGVLASAAALKYVLDRPSRPYEAGSVGREYDAWTREGILEYYWGERPPAAPR